MSGSTGSITQNRRHRPQSCQSGSTIGPQKPTSPPLYPHCPPLWPGAFIWETLLIMLTNLTLLAPASGVVALLLAVSLFFRVRAQPAGNAKMAVIAEDIRVGSMAFLKVEFSILAVYALVAFGIIFFTLGQLTAISFLIGAAL